MKLADSKPTTAGRLFASLVKLLQAKENEKGVPQVPTVLK